MNVLKFMMVFGGSINVVLYFLVMVNLVDVDFILEDIYCVLEVILFLVDLVLFGKYYMEDFCNVGGIFVVFKYLIVVGFIDGGIFIVMGKIFVENVLSWFLFDFGQIIIWDIMKFIKKLGYLCIFYGNFVFGGVVVKIIGLEGDFFIGRVCVFNKEYELNSVFFVGFIKDEEEGQVLIVCYEGFKGGLGMFEQFQVSVVIMGVGLKKIVFVMDGCYSGVSYGFIVGYVVFEVVVGGFIVFVEDGDFIIIDVVKNSIDIIEVLGIKGVVGIVVELECC